MKKHNTFKIILGFILFLILLTWIIPGSVFQDKVVNQGLVQMGLFDFFNYLLTSLSYFGHLFLYIIVVGGFYGILNKVPAYHNLIDVISKKVVGKENIVLFSILTILSILVSFLGIDVEILILVPFLVSLIFKMGYDKIVVAITIIGSILVGVAGSTFAYGKLGMLNSTLSVDFYSNLAIKFVVLIVGISLLIFNLYLYIKRFSGLKIKSSNELKQEEEDIMIDNIKTSDLEKESNEVNKKTVKKTTTKKDETKNNKTKKVVQNKTTKKENDNSKLKTGNSSKQSSKKTTKKSTKNKNISAFKDEDVIVLKNNNSDKLLNSSSSKLKLWPIVTLFIIFVIMVILAYIPWSNVFKIEFFMDLKKSIVDFELFDFPLFGKLFGQFNALGQWNVADIIFLMFIIISIISIIYKVKLDDIFEGFFEGIKNALKPAFIVILIYLILVLVTYHPFQLTIYKSILSLFKGFNIFTSSFAMILSSLFNGDFVYVSQSLIPYLMSVVTDKSLYSIIGIMIMGIYGITMFIAPTSLVMMTILTYLDLNYLDWLKNIWKFVVEFFVILLIIVSILVFI